MKKYLLLIYIMIILILNTGCKKYIVGKTDIEDISIVKVAGIDKYDDEIDLVSISKTKSSGGGGANQEPKIIPTMLFSKGRTIFEAVRNQHTFSEKKIFWGNIEDIIFGSQVARDNIRKVVDFIIRGNQFRLNTELFLVKNNSAKNLILDSKSEEVFIGDVLSALSRNRDGKSVSTEVKIVDLINMLDSKTTSAYLPCIHLVNNKIIRGNESKTNIELSGLGVFKDDRLSYYLNEDETRGFNWIKGNVVSGIIVVKDTTNEYVSLEIIRSLSNIKTYINNKIPRVEINIDFYTNVGEQQSYTDIYNKKEIDYMNMQQEEIVKEEAKNVIKKAQRMNTDIFGFGDKIYHQHPGKWKDIEPNWEKLFPKLLVDVNVNSRVSRTYVIERPTEFNEKGKK